MDVPGHDHEGLVRRQIAAGVDPIVVWMSPEDAEGVIDADSIIDVLSKNGAFSKEQYDRRLVMVLEHIRSVWPLCEKITYPMLADILNANAFVSPFGKPWTVPNLRQKVESVRFDIGTIFNPNGVYGTVTVGDPIGEAIAERVAGSIRVQPSVLAGPREEDSLTAPAVRPATAAEAEERRRAAYRELMGEELPEGA